MMPGNPQVGMTYREEYYFNEAEDQAAIEDVGITITVPYGTFNNCIKTRNWTELERGIIENKNYASGFGLISETNVKENTEIKLVGVK